MSQIVVEMNLNLKPKSCSQALALQNTKPLNFKIPTQHLVLQITWVICCATCGPGSCSLFSKHSEVGIK